MRKSVILFVFLLIFVLVAGIFAVRAVQDSRQNNRAIIAEAKAYNEKSQDLWQQKISLESEISKCKKLVSDVGTNLGSVVLLLTEPSQKFESYALPLMKEKNLCGVIAVSSGDLKNTEENLSAQRLAELQEAGWEICLSVTDSTNLGELYHEIISAGLKAPKTMYLPEGSLTEILAQNVAQYGITTVVQHSGTVDGETAYGLSCLAATGSFESKVSESRRGLSSQLVGQAENRSGAIVLTTGFQRARESYEQSNFELMVTDIAKRVEDGTIAATDCPTAWERLSEADKTVDSAEQAHRDELAALQAQLAEVNAKLRDLSK